MLFVVRDSSCMLYKAKNPVMISQLNRAGVEACTFDLGKRTSYAIPSWIYFCSHVRIEEQNHYYM